MNHTAYHATTEADGGVLIAEVRQLRLRVRVVGVQGV